MVDIVDPKTRSRMMSGIRSKNTRPETLVRKRLHALGYRFRVHRRDLPGSPDIVFPRYNAAILVNGCFWHGHGCRLFKWPKTRPEFWREKILGNIQRDERKLSQLRDLGWRIGALWECEMRGASEDLLNTTIAKLADWLESDRTSLDLPHSCTQNV